MSEPLNRASKRSKQSKVEHCGVSERSEQCERTNVASDRVARKNAIVMSRNRLRVICLLISSWNTYKKQIVSEFYIARALFNLDYLSMTKGEKN